MNKTYSTGFLYDSSRLSSASGLFFLGLILMAVYQPGWFEIGLNHVQDLLVALAEAVERFVPALR